MKLIKEFKDFAMRGNVLDLAVGVIIGSAFGRIVSSLVSDILMPLLSLVIGQVSFVDLKIVFTEATETSAEVALLYGSFLQNVFDFLIIAFSIFMVIRLMMRFKKKEAVIEQAEAKPDPTIVLLTEIRDALRSK